MKIKPGMMMGMALLFASGVSGMADAAIETGKSIDFAAGDFTNGTATKSWSVAATDGTANVWAVYGVIQDGGDANRLNIFNGEEAIDQTYVSWKITVPTQQQIKSFSFKATKFYLNGNGDDVFKWEYSTGDNVWHELYTKTLDQNHGFVDPAPLLTATLATPSQTLYIRAVKYEGTNQTDTGYYAFWAYSDTSSVSVTTVPAPEASSLASLGLMSIATLLKRK